MAEPRQEKASLKAFWKRKKEKDIIPAMIKMGRRTPRMTRKMPPISLKAIERMKQKPMIEKIALKMSFIINSFHDLELNRSSIFL